MADKITQLQKELGTIIKGKKEVTDKNYHGSAGKRTCAFGRRSWCWKDNHSFGTLRLMGMDFNRIQFTPDVVPSDVTGFTMYEKQTGRFI